MSNHPECVAVLFADLGGSTRLYDLLGDEPARRIVAACIDRIIEIVERHAGRLIKTIGDEVMSTFDSANRAADAAREIVIAMRAMEPVHDQRLGAHVGLHYGRVLHEEGDVFGDTVNLAARLVPLAKTGEILTTRAVVDALSAERQGLVRRIDRRELRGKQGELEIFELLWQTANITTITPIPRHDPAGGERLVLQLGADRFEIHEGHPSLTIGRDDDNDLVLPDPRVSRRHARVKRRHGKFVLCDESTNGTLVRTAEGKSILLHREEMILHGSGRLGVAQYPEVGVAQYPEVGVAQHPDPGAALPIAFRVVSPGAANDGD